MKFLVIRRDNIGDLICTTPLIRNLRQHYPDAMIDVLVNSYNQAAVAHNPDINHVYVYTKGKHREAGQNPLTIHWQRLELLLSLRKKHYNVAIMAQIPFSQYAFRLAKWAKPKTLIGYAPPPPIPKLLTHPIAPISDENSHEVTRVLTLLTPLAINIDWQAPLVLHPSPTAKAHYEQQVASSEPKKIVLGIHISARKVDQRWPENRFIELIRALHNLNTFSFRLFWSPGDENNPQHPGDDQKAARIIQALPDIPITPCPTVVLSDLIAAMSLCDQVVCSDGGAMHIAAGLGKSIVCFFGSSNAQQWHPWGVAHKVLQPTSQQVNDVNVTDVLDALSKLTVQS